MRSLPDIYKTSWYQVHVEEDVVQIPEVSHEMLLVMEELARKNREQELEDGDGGDFIEVAVEDRRQGPRRLAGGRRAEDSESLDSLKQRWRDRLAQTKEEFFAGIEPMLMDTLQAQMWEVREEALRQELVGRRAEINGVLQDMDNRMRNLEQSHAAFMREYAEELKYMALDIAERLLRNEIDGDKRALESMVLQLVSEVKNASWITVEVSGRVDGLADNLRAQLSMAEQGIPIYVEAKDVPPDSVRVETEEGAMDATISLQLKQIREAFMRAEEEGQA